MKKKRWIVGLALACAFALPLAFAACGDGGDDEGGSVTDQVDPTWKKAIEDFCAESGVANSDVMTEMQIFVAHYSSFTLANGKYTAASLASVNGFVCKNIEIVMDGTKIVSVSYEFRTASKDTPDRLITIDKDGVKKTDIPKPTDGEKMDEEEWNQQATVFANVTNYTLRRDSVETGELAGAMKLDGTTYYETTGLSEGIYETVGGKYYHYYRNALSSEWIKEEVEASEYASSVQVPSLMVTVAAQAVQENFSSFEFDAGVYTADELTVEYAGMEFTLRDMEITVSGGKIVRAVCVLVDGYWGDGDERITVDQIGSTEIVYPTTFTDKTQSGGEGGDVQGEETFEKAWMSEMSNVSNFTLNVSLGKTEYGTVYCTEDGWGQILKDKSSSEVSETHAWAYMIKEGNACTEYYSDDGAKWFKVPNAMTLEDVQEMIGNFTAYLRGLEEHFGDFSFENGKYVCDSLTVTLNGQSVPLDSVEAVFVDDKLVSLTLEFLGNMRYSYSQIGETVITAPKDAVEVQGGGDHGDQGGQADEGVTAAVWDSEIDRVSTNFTFEAPYEDDSTSELRYTLRDGDNIETYSLKDDVRSSVLRDIKDTVGYTEYTYSVKDAKWTKHYFKATDDAVQTTLGIYSDPLQGLKGHFDDFTYENGKYVCEEITLEVEGEPLEFESFEVVFEGNKLVSVTFERLGGVQFTFSKLGETHVEAPAEYDTEKAAEGVDEFGDPKNKADDTAA